MQQNGQKKMDAIIEKIRERGVRPTILLHACCAPCACACLERLLPDFQITVFFYNPNITEESEYRKRAEELQRLIREMNVDYGQSIAYSEGTFSPERFRSVAGGLENAPEGGVRCFACYRLREEETAAAAAAGKFDYFATTLTLSPLKNAQKLNEIGEALAKDYGVAYLPSDFKKKDGYKRSLALSKEYGLYRQNYCGCVYSART